MLVHPSLQLQAQSLSQSVYETHNCHFLFPHQQELEGQLGPEWPSAGKK